MNLSLTDLDKFDVRGIGQKRRLCPSEQCRGKRADLSHRSMSVVYETGAFFCHRCNEGGYFTESWAPKPKLSRQQRSLQAARRFFG